MDAKKLKMIRIGVVTLAVAFIIIGVFRGEAVQVYKKATDICLACMGIAH